MRGSLWQPVCNLATTEAPRGLGIQNKLLDEMKVEFEEFPDRRVCTDVKCEGAPLEYADHPPAALRAAAEEKDRASALIPTVPQSALLPPSLPEVDFESQRGFQEPLPPVFQAVTAATSQGLRDRSRSPPQDAVSRETAEQARRAHALTSTHRSHQERRVQAPSLEESSDERQPSNQARERLPEQAPSAASSAGMPCQRNPMVQS